MTCYLCNSSQIIRRQGHCRDLPTVYPLECVSCGLVFLSSFEHLQPGYYEDSKMHEKPPVDFLLEDAQAICDAKRRFDAVYDMILEPRESARKTDQPNTDLLNVLDFGCGQALWIEKIRPLVNSVVGVEPEKSLQPYFAEKGLTVFPSLEDMGKEQSFDLITMFHVLEHLPDPRPVLMELSHLLTLNGVLVIEVPNANDALLTLYKSDVFSTFTYWSCHLFLYTASTIQTLLSQCGLKTKQINQVQRYPLANHLHWLANKKPGGQTIWPFLDTPDLQSAYSQALAERNLCDTIWVICTKL